MNLVTYIKCLFTGGTTANGIATVGTDAATLAVLVALVASLVSVIINAISGSNGFWFFTQAELGWVAGISASLLIVARQLVSALQNAGISANQGVVVKVTNGLSTVVGILVTATMWVSSVWASISGSVSALGLTPATAAAIGAVISVTLVVGKALQVGLQNFSLASALKSGRS